MDSGAAAARSHEKQRRSKGPCRLWVARGEGRPAAHFRPWTIFGPRKSPKPALHVAAMNSRACISTIEAPKQQPEQFQTLTSLAHFCKSELDKTSSSTYIPSRDHERTTLLSRESGYDRPGVN